MSNTYDIKTFQGLILTLQDYWSRQGCMLAQPFDMEVGAGTSHPMTFLKAIGPEPHFCAYVQPSRRPTDGRYGENPNRLQRYFQFQVVLKPSPDNIQDLYLGSLRELGFDPAVHDIRFVEDNWENPTLGAWGLGWEVWLNGMEYIQGVNNVYDLVWANTPAGIVTYGDVFHQNEVEQSTYNFEYADVDFLFGLFDRSAQECQHLLDTQKVKAALPLPAYERILRAAHAFNLLDARHAISVTERQRYILRIRELSKGVAEAYYAARESLGFPILNKVNKA